VIVTLAVPVLFPLQSSLTGVDLCTAGPLLLPTATVFVTEQALASVTVKVYVVAERLVAVCPLAVLLQVYVNVPVPPDALATALPLFPPQLALPVVKVGVESTFGSVTLTDAVVVQLLLSVIVTT